MFGGQGLPNFLPFLNKALSVDINHELEKQPHENHVVAPPNINHAFVEELGVVNLSRRSFEKDERILHSHGHTF